MVIQDVKSWITGNKKFTSISMHFAQQGITELYITIMWVSTLHFQLDPKYPEQSVHLITTLKSFLLDNIVINIELKKQRLSVSVFDFDLWNSFDTKGTFPCSKGKCHCLIHHSDLNKEIIIENSFQKRLSYHY